MPRLVLFIDRQNVYKNAREAFFPPTNQHYYGQVNPMELGTLVLHRANAMNATLHQVRIYCGEPDSNRQPKTYAARMKQCKNWRDSGAIPVTRLLRYPNDWPKSKPQEKGVDVALAIDFVTMAVNGDYDIGVIASTDFDLSPALEFVYHKFPQIRIAVTSWRSQTFKRRLFVKSANIWCHYLDRTDYDSIADLTDYNTV